MADFFSEGFYSALDSCEMSSMLQKELQPVLGDKMTAGKECQTKCHALYCSNQLMELKHQTVKMDLRFDAQCTCTNLLDKTNYFFNIHNTSLTIDLSCNFQISTWK